VTWHYPLGYCVTALKIRHQIVQSNAGIVCGGKVLRIVVTRLIIEVADAIWKSHNIKKGARRTTGPKIIPVLPLTSAGAHAGKRNWVGPAQPLRREHRRDRRNHSGRGWKGNPDPKRLTWDEIELPADAG
jgi:hypothetical protein